VYIVVTYQAKPRSARCKAIHVLHAVEEGLSPPQLRTIKLATAKNYHVLHGTIGRDPTEGLNGDNDANRMNGINISMCRSIKKIGYRLTVSFQMIALLRDSAPEIMTGQSTV